MIVEATAPSRGLQVDFTPLGAYLFFGMPMRELSNRTLRLDDVLGPAANRIAAQLDDTPHWDTRFDILDAFIMKRIAAGTVPAPGVMRAWDRLEQTGGQVGIGALADEVGWSRKHLVSRFHEQVGLPPKTMARILRFDAVTRRLNASNASNDGRLAYVAHSCGYYDQAHFNRDFREFAGTTPGEYLSRRLPDGGGILAD